MYSQLKILCLYIFHNLHMKINDVLELKQFNRNCCFSHEKYLLDIISFFISLVQANEKWLILFYDNSHGRTIYGRRRKNNPRVPMWNYCHKLTRGNENLSEQELLLRSDSKLYPLIYVITPPVTEQPMTGENNNLSCHQIYQTIVARATALT